MPHRIRRPEIFSPKRFLSEEVFAGDRALAWRRSCRDQAFSLLSPPEAQLFPRYRDEKARIDTTQLGICDHMFDKLLIAAAILDALADGVARLQRELRVVD